jgi:phosphatidylglycerophosphate synthase
MPELAPVSNVSSGSATFFIELSPGENHRLVVGGLSVLERNLRILARRGATRAIIPSTPVPMRADLPVAVDWIAPGSPPPSDIQVARGDEIGGERVTPENQKAVEWKLCRTLNKSHQGLVDAWINWRFSMRITRELAKTKITPNQVTVFATLVGLTACSLLLFRTWVSIAVGGVLIQVHSILDSCDGELSRLRYQGSKLGQWLDNITDDFLDDLFGACAGIAAGGIWMWIGIAGALGRAFSQGTIYRDVYKRTGSGDVYQFRLWFEKDKANIEEVYDKRSPLTYLRNVGRRDTYVFIYMILCSFKLVSVVSVYSATIGLINFVTLSLHLILKPRNR